MTKTKVNRSSYTTDNNSNIVKVFAEEGTIKLLLEVVKEHINNAEIYKQCFTAIWGLTKDNGKNTINLHT